VLLLLQKQLKIDKIYQLKSRYQSTFTQYLKINIVLFVEATNGVANKRKYNEPYLPSIFNT